MIDSLPIDSLPECLGERTRVHDNASVRDMADSGEFVVYWMQTAVRARENPAFDVARWIAHQLGCPLLVYQTISEHDDFASDRHHTFVLQGARDVQNQFLKTGVSYAFHLATRDDRRSHLLSLANRASAVVTEEMPVDPHRRCVNDLRQQTQTPILSVDTACVSPMKLVKKAFTRAFKFRSATEDFYAERLTRDWPTLDVETKPFDISSLPFDSIDLQTADLAELVARCEIDHAIGPVVDTVGGSAAGYERWNKFRGGPLNRYAKQRNNALLDGVSRMSPYLHYGMVSPFRIAREAAEIGNAGSEKYLDELLIWRELAYSFCFHREDHDQWSAIPDWAQETLIRHADDHREQTYSWEQLARGETNDEFWNAAQKSLLMQGELHNNVRMTWGKAILNWKQSPQAALATIIDLNHRYALDGRDPASYGGILWCLGQFDRPFEPNQNILGVVRPRPISQHASRLDPQTYLAKVTRPRFGPVPHVAVIGAGISGLFAARTLRDHGMKVTVFEKSRGVGGRMATRRIDGGIRFDHGAQYFTARDQRFSRYVESWIEQGLVAKWPDRDNGNDQHIVVLEDGGIQSKSDSDDRYVAVPTMNAICKHLADELEIRTQTRIAEVKRIDDRVELFDESANSLSTYDRLIVSAPSAQSAELMADFPEVAASISKIKMNPCWATMVVFEKPITDQWVGAFLHGSFLSWAARNSTKPGRNHDVEHCVIHANSEWTAANWEQDAEKIAQMMLAEFWRVSGIPPQSNIHIQSHRWKYAIPVDPCIERCFADESSIAVACGDWASGSRVEGAFLSGMAAAGQILGHLSPTQTSEKQQSTLFDA